jgi:hypothetical protein
MAPVGIPLLLAFFSLLLWPLPAAAEPELWACKRTDGSTIYTNHTKGVTGCNTYPLRAELGYMKRTEAPAPAQKEEPKPPASQTQAAGQPININIIVNSPPPAPPLQRIEVQPPVSEIPFEVVRMLSVGMSEAEILRRAGLPQTTLIGGGYSFGSPYSSWPIFGANRFVYSSGDWLVELTFTGGRVATINQTRVRP